MLSPAFIFTAIFWLLICLALPALSLFGVETETRASYSTLLQIFTPLLATILCLRTAWVFESGDDLRKVWILLGLGVFAWGFGAMIYGAYYFMYKTEPPYPGYADIGYLMMQPLIISGLWIFKRSLQVKTPLWGIIVALIVFIATMTLGFWSNIENLQEAETTFIYLVALAYIIFDPTLLGITVISASLLAGGLAALPWWLGLSGLFLYYIGNISYDYTTAVGTYATGGVVDITWPLAFGLIALAALITHTMFKIE